MRRRSYRAGWPRRGLKPHDKGRPAFVSPRGSLYSIGPPGPAVASRSVEAHGRGGSGWRRTALAHSPFRLVDTASDRVKHKQAGATNRALAMIGAKLVRGTEIQHYSRSQWARIYREGIRPKLARVPWAARIRPRPLRAGKGGDKSPRRSRPSAMRRRRVRSTARPLTPVV